MAAQDNSTGRAPSTPQTPLLQPRRQWQVPQRCYLQLTLPSTAHYDQPPTSSLCSLKFCPGIISAKRSVCIGTGWPWQRRCFLTSLKIAACCSRFLNVPACSLLSHHCRSRAWHLLLGAAMVSPSPLMAPPTALGGEKIRGDSFWARGTQTASLLEDKCGAAAALKSKVAELSHG